MLKITKCCSLLVHVNCKVFWKMCRLIPNYIENKGSSNYFQFKGWAQCIVGHVVCSSSALDHASMIFGVNEWWWWFTESFPAGRDSRWHNLNKAVTHLNVHWNRIMKTRSVSAPQNTFQWSVLKINIYF